MVIISSVPLCSAVLRPHLQPGKVEQKRTRICSVSNKITLPIDLRVTEGVKGRKKQGGSFKGCSASQVQDERGCSQNGSLGGGEGRRWVLVYDDDGANRVCCCTGEEGRGGGGKGWERGSQGNVSKGIRRRGGFTQSGGHSHPLPGLCPEVGAMDLELYPGCPVALSCLNTRY